MKRCAVVSSHPNSRSSHGSQLLWPQVRLHSVSRAPISITSASRRLLRRRISAACSARMGSVVTGLAGAALDLLRNTCISASLWLGGLGPRNARSPGGPFPGLLFQAGFGCGVGFALMSPVGSGLDADQR